VPLLRLVSAAGVEGLQQRTLNDDGVVHYLRTGREPVRTRVGRLEAGRRHGNGSAPLPAEARRP
jgi:hypothetical protein